MAHRHRAYPSPGQLATAARHCSDARFVWNLALEQANWYRTKWGPTPSSTARQRQLAEARQVSCPGEGSSSVQQQALRDFTQALSN